MPMLQIEVDDELLFKLGELKNRFRAKTWKQFVAFLGNNAVVEENRISYWIGKTGCTSTSQEGADFGY